MATENEGEQEVGKPVPRRYGRLGLQLALALVGVAVGAVIAANIVAAVTVYSDVRQILMRQEADETSAAALGAAAAYTPGGWASELTPVIAVADRSGARIQVRNRFGDVVRSSPGYARYPGPAHTAPVHVNGRSVGSVTLKFGDQGIGAIIGHFQAQRWRARFIAAGAGVLFALVVAFFLAPLIASPVDRLLRTARARGSGYPETRVGSLRGPRDLRELAAAFDQMADTLDQQEQLRRNLVAYMAHELRTPTAILQAGTEAMLDRVTELTPTSLESLHDETVRLGQMVEDLQRLAAAEAAALKLTVTPSDLATVAAAAADSMIRMFAGKKIRMTRRLATVSVTCDQARMREVITNLLGNAVKFTPAGGQIILETRPSGNLAMLQVSDNGVGIPPDELPHLTERFYRGSGTATIVGSGIGLALVDELVRAHHGTMSIASQPGQGTRVTIKFPRLL